MMKKNIIYLFILIGFILVSTTGCKKEMIIKIDNPTAKMVQLKIDDLTYKIKSNHLGSYKILSGEHKLIIDSDTIDIYFHETLEYVLNPTQSTYIIASIKYGDYEARRITNILDEADKLLKDYKKSESIIKNDIVSYEDTLLIDIGDTLLIPFTLYPEFEKYDSIILVTNWDYGILTPLPKEISVVNYNNSSFIFKKVKKIFRRRDFVNFIMNRE